MVIDQDPKIKWSKTDGGIRFYINGEQSPLNVAASGKFTAGNSAQTPIVLGGTFTDNARAFNGALDNVLIYDRALTEKQIKQNTR